MSREESREDYQPFLATKSFSSLDGLRAASILAVLWHHASGSVGSDWTIADRGFLGVDLFFVISGFLIVTLLLRERRKNGDVSLRGFYVRRFLRIFPVYYALLALLTTAALLRHSNQAAALRHDLPYAFLYISNLVPMVSFLGITWSLSTEEQFYLVVPTLEKYLRRHLVYVLPAAYVLFSLPALGLFPTWNLPGFFRQTTFGPILLGVILAHVLDDPRGYHWFWRLLRHRFSPLVASALVLLACSHPALDISGWPRMTIHGSLVLLVASCVVREQHGLQRVLNWWPLRRIGVVSYGIYLYHLLVMHLVDKGLGHFGLASKWIHFVVLSLAAWAVAEISYRLYEMRFLAMKARFLR
jgi:peptidoglycan/LPS O-acetylase OafA/YrhL